METIGKITTVLMIMIVTAVCGGYVIMKLWGWLIVPAFGFAPLQLAHAMGFVFFCRAVLPVRVKTNEDEKEKSLTKRFLNDFGTNVTFWIVALLFGYLIQLAY